MAKIHISKPLFIVGQARRRLRRYPPLPMLRYYTARNSHLTIFSTWMLLCRRYRALPLLLWLLLSILTPVDWLSVILWLRHINTPTLAILSRPMEVSLAA